MSQSSDSGVSCDSLFFSTTSTNNSDNFSETTITAEFVDNGIDAVVIPPDHVEYFNDFVLCAECFQRTFLSDAHYMCKECPGHAVCFNCFDTVLQNDVPLCSEIIVVLYFHSFRSRLHEMLPFNTI